MKKLMIAAAIVCAAAVSQAASGSWGTGVMNWTGVGGELNGSGVLCQDETTAWLFYDLTQAEYDALGTNAKDIYAKFDSVAGTLNLGERTAEAIDTWYAVDGAVDFTMASDDFTGKAYAVVIVEHTDASGNVDAFSANTMTSLEPVSGQLELKGIDAVALGWGEAAGGTATTWQSVPEPTSGLLLILGVAGLALRRRRA